MTENFLDSLYEQVRIEQLGEATGHDWAHTCRVYRMAGEIAIAEGFSGDFIMLRVVALLHDYADHKFFSQKTERYEKIRALLLPYGLPEEQIAEIFSIIERISFSQNSGDASPELLVQILRDADRLDGLGAIGIARTFAYGGKAGQCIFDESGKMSDSLSHFYEKLLHLKDGMYTSYAKQLAESRHEFLVTYLRQFYLEYFGEADGQSFFERKLEK